MAKCPEIARGQDGYEFQSQKLPYGNSTDWKTCCKGISTFPMICSSEPGAST